MTKLNDIAIHDIWGEPLDWSLVNGRKLLIVNVATECGYTPQYTQLEALYAQFSDSLMILGCPCNDFGGQEPGSEAEIATFCQTRYGVTFPMTQKIWVYPIFALSCIS